MVDKRSTARDKFLLGAPVRLEHELPEYFIRNGELNRNDTYWVHNKYTIHVGKKRTSRAAYILRTANGRIIELIEFYSSDLRHANG